MQIQLRYTENNGQPIAAAFVPGASPAEWFGELGRWEVDVKDLRCFIMPQSLGDDSGSGLFVVFGAQLPTVQNVRHPYGKVGEKLFIPIKAELYPPVGIDELKVLLLWDIQVFHPAIGLVGFEKGDVVELSSFVYLRPPVAADWGFAHAGLPDAPLLQQISLDPDEAQENVLDAIKEDVGSKDLMDIPGTEIAETGLGEAGDKALNVFKKAALLLLLIFALFANAIAAIIGALFSLVQPRSKGAGESIFSKMEKWVGKQLADLQKERDSELKRLMDLFDKDTDEALQYAIPLNSPYLSRGTAPPSTKLGRRSTQFNLSGLGGGSRVDNWDTGAYGNLLRNRYEKAANDAIAAGNYKRAAYIYAHLLGNFYSAANVLVQGKFYREAAALYQDHLKSDVMAAECLEKGGLLDEAIPIYIRRNNFEKVGDLYRQLGREQQAHIFYRKTLEELKTAKDYQKAAKLTLDKLQQKDEAMGLLLDGWKDTARPEACLKAYLELSHNPDDDSLNHTVMRLYETDVPKLKKTAFLSVLAGVSKTYPETTQTSLGIAYEIASEQAELGDDSALKLLGVFLPRDRLLTSDTNRFIQNRLQLPPVYTKPTYIALRNDTEWLSLATYHDQLLGIGIRHREIHFARANWEGKTTYHFLFKTDSPTPKLSLFADAFLGNEVLIAGSGLSARVKQTLPAYSFFDREVNLRTLEWLPNGAVSCCLNGDKGISLLHHELHGLALSNFTIDGKLLNTHVLKFDEDKVAPPPQVMFDPAMMVWRKGHFYYAVGDVLVRIQPDGNMEIANVHSHIVKMAATAQHTALKIALLTTDGCLMVTPTLKEMKATSAPFAQDMVATDIKLMTDNRLVVAAGKQAKVYDLSTDTPNLQGSIETENLIKAIIAIPKRHHCAFLEVDNRVSVYQINPSQDR